MLKKNLFSPGSKSVAFQFHSQLLELLGGQLNKQS